MAADWAHGWQGSADQRCLQDEVILRGAAGASSLGRDHDGSGSVPDRKPAKAAGFRGGRYISAEASARGEWAPGGSTMAGSDAYATSKQAVLAAALELARENPRLHVNAVEPGFIPATSLGRDANVFIRFLLKYVLTWFAPHVKYRSTPAGAARMITKVLTDPGRTGTYLDDGGEPMLASARARDPEFQKNVVAETRSLLATVPN